MKTYENPFHRGHLYIQIEDEDLYDGIVQKMEDLFQGNKRPLQTSVSSDESECIRLLLESGFLLKRKCYEMNVCRSDLLLALEKNPNELLKAEKGSETYAACAEMMFRYYALTHASVNPLTASLEEFTYILPSSAVYTETNGVIGAVAFIEKNEIAYLASDSPKDLPSFLASLLERMFAKYDYIFFEADDVDPAAMSLMNMFSKRPTVSFDTYVKTRGYGAADSSVS